MMLVLTASCASIQSTRLKSQKGNNASETKHAKHTSVKGATYRHSWRQASARINFALRGKREFILKESQNFICGLKPKKEIFNFFSFFSPKFDIK